MPSLRRPVALGIALTIVVGLAGGSAYGVNGADPEVAEPEEVERELDQAARSLEEIEAALDVAEGDILAAEQRLSDARAALEAVEEELAAAEQAAADARAARRARTAELVRTQEQLETATAAHHAAVDRLQDRSVEVFKYGTGRPQHALVTGVMGSNDWHEVAVTTSAVARVVAADRALLTEATRTREEADAARAAADDAKAAAIVAEEQALAEGEELRAIVEEHELAVAAVREERQQREVVLASLQADGELAALLVSELEHQLAIAIARVAEPEPVPPPVPEPEPTPDPDPTADPADVTDPTDSSGDAGSAAPADEPAPAPDDLPAWTDRLPAVGQPWASQIDAATRANGVDGRLFAALVWTESAFRPDAQSWVGAIGLAQLMPDTAAELGVDPWDPIENLDGGARYLDAQYRSFGSIELALAAYNAGPNAVLAAGPGIPNYVETQLYVVRVLERYNHLGG